MKRVVSHLRGTFLVAVTLSIGLAANVVVVSIAYRLLSAPPPLVENPHALRSLEFDRPDGDGIPQSEISLAEYERLKTHASPALAVTVHVSYQGNARVEHAQSPASRVSIVAATPEYWSVLRPVSVRGRVFGPSDARSTAPVAVVSEQLARRLGLASVEPGESLRIDGVWTTVVGIVPRGFQGTEPGTVHAWLPLDQVLRSPGGDGTSRLQGLSSDARVFSATGRLPFGKRESQASARVRNVLAPGAAVRLRRPRLLGGGDRKAVGLLTTILQGAAILLAAIAVTNAAGLTLVSYLRRTTEFAIRTALGCTRRQLLGHLGAESLAQSLVVLLIGVPLASAGLRLIRLFIADDRARELFARATSAEPVVVFAAAGLSTVVSLLASAAPAAQVTAMVTNRLSAALGGSRASRLVDSGHRLVGVQTALSVCMLMVAGLLVRTAVTVRGTPSGMDLDGVRFARVEPSSLGYDDGRALQLASRLYASLNSSAVLRGAALARQAPLQSNGWSVQVDGVPRSGEARIGAGFNVVSANYFDFLTIEILAGRPFLASDGPDSEPAAVVNRTLARRLWGNGLGVGRRVQLTAERAPRIVVGIVEDTKYTGLTRPSGPYLFLPISQPYALAASGFAILTRPATSPSFADRFVALALNDLDPNLAMGRFALVTDQTNRELALQQLLLSFVSLAGGAGLVLVAMGLQASLSRTGNTMRREMAIRLALGATPGHLAGLLARRIARSVVVGLVVGWLGAVLAGLALSKLLIGAVPSDPAINAAVVGCVVVAIAGPALRQWWLLTRLQPSRALGAD